MSVEARAEHVSQCREKSELFPFTWFPKFLKSFFKKSVVTWSKEFQLSTQVVAAGACFSNSAISLPLDGDLVCRSACWQFFPWEADCRSAVRKFPAFYGARLHLAALFPQDLFVLFSHLCLGLPCGHPRSGMPTVFIVFPMLAIPPTNRSNSHPRVKLLNFLLSI